MKYAASYGVPEKYLFQPDDLVVQAHFYKYGAFHSNIILIKCVFRVTRAVFAFAELTNTDAEYCGPEFDFDKIIKELMNKVRRRPFLASLQTKWCLQGIRRKSSIHDTTLQSLHNINSIFANLMQVRTQALLSPWINIFIHSNICQQVWLNFIREKFANFAIK